MPTERSGLSIHSLGYLNYLHGVLSQPTGSWEGFYMPQSPSMNFALRYQLAFAAYAVAGMAQQTPAYRAPYAEAIRGAIDKMLDVASWGYWRASEPGGNGGADAASSSHVAVMLGSPVGRQHGRAPAGPPSDPIVRDNLQYSGHLSTLLGLYEKLTRDGAYDLPFELRDPGSGVAYSYTHSEVAGRIHEQMRENRFGGVCCEPGIAYVPCNNHALASNALHDAVHGTDYGRANARWLRLVRGKMVLKGPAVRGLFAVCYLKDVGLGAPVAFNFTDAWGLAFLLPFDPSLVRKLYGKFKRRITRAGSDGAYLDSSPINERMEISDVPINTGFASIVARGMGDHKLAEALERYSSGAFDAGWDGPSYRFKGTPRTLHATALFALASAIEPGGESFSALFNDPPDPIRHTQPFVSHLKDSGGRVGVSRATYDPPSRALKIGLRQVSDPSALRAGEPQPVTLFLGNITGEPYIEVDGSPLTHTPNGQPASTIELPLTVEPQRELSCVVRF
jgi:hypothetical protein